jgi:nuclear cap-binding protein subunit 1
MESLSAVNRVAQILECGLTVLKALNSSDFNDIPNSFPQPYIDGPELTAPPFDLPSVLVPPEVIELDGLAADSSEDAKVKKEEWPEYYISLFDNDVRLFISSKLHSYG